jgi:hypothetical protein
MFQQYKANDKFARTHTQDLFDLRESKGFYKIDLLEK